MRWPSHVKYDLGIEWEIEKNPDSDFDGMKSMMTHRKAVNHGFVVGGEVYNNAILQQSSQFWAVFLFMRYSTYYKPGAHDAWEHSSRNLGQYFRFSTTDTGSCFVRRWQTPQIVEFNLQERSMDSGNNTASRRSIAFRSDARQSWGEKDLYDNSLWWSNCGPQLSLEIVLGVPTPSI